MCRSLAPLTSRGEKKATIRGFARRMATEKADRVAAYTHGARDHGARSHGAAYTQGPWVPMGPSFWKFKGRPPTAQPTWRAAAVSRFTMLLAAAARMPRIPRAGFFGDLALVRPEVLICDVARVSAAGFADSEFALISREDRASLWNYRPQLRRGLGQKDRFLRR